LAQKTLAFVVYSCYKITSPRGCGRVSRRPYNLVFQISSSFIGEKCVYWVAASPQQGISLFRGGYSMPITKEQIIAAMQSLARELGHTPTTTEFTRLSGMNDRNASRLFKTYLNAVRAAGLEPNKRGQRLSSAALLADWGEVARKVGWVPTRREYLREGSYGYIVFRSRFQRWVEVPKEFCRFAASGGLAGDWTDVMEKIRRGPIPRSGGGKRVMRLREAVKQEALKQEALKQEALKREAIKEEALKQESIKQEARRVAAIEPAATEWGGGKSAAMELAAMGGADTRAMGNSDQGGREENPAMAQMIPPPLLGKKCVTATMLAVFIAETAPTGLPWITGACFPRRVLTDRPLLGEPIRTPGMEHAPVNEMGVMLLFGMVAVQLGIVVESVRAAFPDCLAKIEVEPGRWQYLRIEFEYESRAFQEHGHDPQQCDMIVCWKHNWKGCPPHLQVLELSRIVGLGR
jgi:hypothetical protein